MRTSLKDSAQQRSRAKPSSTVRVLGACLPLIRRRTAKTREGRSQKLRGLRGQKSLTTWRGTTRSLTNQLTTLTWTSSRARSTQLARTSRGSSSRSSSSSQSSICSSIPKRQPSSKAKRTNEIQKSLRIL